MKSWTDITDLVAPYVRGQAKASGVPMGTWVGFSSDQLFLSYTRGDMVLLTRQEAEQDIAVWSVLVRKRVHEAIASIIGQPSVIQRDEYEETMRAEDIIKSLDMSETG